DREPAVDPDAGTRQRDRANGHEQPQSPPEWIEEVAVHGRDPDCGYFNWMKRNWLCTRSGVTTIRPPSCGKTHRSAGPLKSLASVSWPPFSVQENTLPVFQSVAMMVPSFA